MSNSKVNLVVVLALLNLALIVWGVGFILAGGDEKPYFNKTSNCAIIGRAAPETDVPAVLKLIPDETISFLSLDLSKLRESQPGKKLIGQIEATSQIPLEGIDRMVLLANKEEELFFDLVLISGTFDQKNMLEDILAEHTRKKVEGRECHVGGDHGVCFLDKQIALIGSEKSIAWFAAQDGQAANGNMALGARTASTQMISGSLNVAASRRAAQGSPSRMQAVLDDVDLVTLALDFDNGVAAGMSIKLNKKSKEAQNLIVATFPELLKSAGVDQTEFGKQVLEQFGKTKAREENSYTHFPLRFGKEHMSAALDFVSHWMQINKNTEQHIKILAQAMRNYACDYKQLPPAAICDKDGKPLLSWRVAILPYIEEQNVYSDFALDEPWDSDRNKKLINIMPKIYMPLRYRKFARFTTQYQVIRTEGAIFAGNKGTKPEDLDKAGRMNDTILIVEAPTSVPWSKPEDLSIDGGKIHPKLFGKAKSIHVVFADGSYRKLSDELDEDQLKAMIIWKNGNAASPQKK